jgi:hypothetical protein
MDSQRFKILMDYLGGAEDQPPQGIRLPIASWLWGVWWAILTLVIALCCGQVSKFIYIDF